MIYGCSLLWRNYFVGHVNTHAYIYMTLNFKSYRFVIVVALGRTPSIATSHSILALLGFIYVSPMDLCLILQLGTAVKDLKYQI